MVWDLVKKAASYTPVGLAYQGGKALYDAASGGGGLFSRGTPDAERITQADVQPDAQAYYWGGSPDAAQQYSQQFMGQAQQMQGRGGPELQRFGGDSAPAVQHLGGPSSVQYGRAQDALGGAGQWGQQQQGLADHLQSVALGGAGPSAAEQAMRSHGEQAMQQQLAMASRARGGAAAGAQLAAGQQQGAIQGQLTRDLGVQRAAEQAQARGELGGVLAQGRGMDLQTAGMQAGMAESQGRFGLDRAALGVQRDIGAGQLGLSHAGLMAQQEATQGGMDLQARAMNDAMTQYYMGLGMHPLDAQLGADMTRDQTRIDATLGLHGHQLGAEQASRGRRTQFLGQLAGGLMQGGGALLASDVRMKERIRPADADSAFRDVYPQAFEYRDPERHGEGQRVGIMAQDLERTPAGQTAVVDTPEGKMVDIPALSTMTAGEVGNIRRELDKVNQEVAQLRSGRTEYPAPQAPPQPPPEQRMAASQAGAEQARRDLAEIEQQIAQLRQGSTVYPQVTPPPAMGGSYY